MWPVILLLLIASIPITADASDVGATMKLSCMYAYASKLRPNHRFWANVRLMKKNGTSDALLDEQKQINTDRKPYMHFKMSANGIKDPKDLYIYIKHNCVRNHTTMYRVKSVDVKMDNKNPMVKNIGTIFLP
ncbi:unnamed protein product [Cylicocyclus nassatus]|uniref:Uncharacterized protein n=1 Tax=Cylicocyclus nassatus TaxID=53992 RepID=A0AA36M3S6_CYLNA|nr:unnamed protein product [Cylicocyclus nassatus]